MQQAGVDGDVTGNTPVYAFSMDGAIAQVPNAAQFQDGFQQDIVHAVIVGPIGQLTAGDNLQWNAGTPAQRAVVDGLLKAVGSQPYPACNPYASPCASQPQVTVAAARFAMLPAATRHAWLAANLAALNARAASPWHGSREPEPGGGCLRPRPLDPGSDTMTATHVEKPPPAAAPAGRHVSPPVCRKSVPEHTQLAVLTPAGSP